MTYSRLLLLVGLLSYSMVACGDDPATTGAPADSEDPEFEGEPDEEEEPLVEDDPVEETHPVVAITSPEDGDMFGTRRIRVNGTAQDLDMVLVNDTPVAVEEGAWTLPLDVEAGEFVIEATGQGAEPDSITILVDFDAPNLTVVTPDLGVHMATDEGVAVLVSGLAVDPESGLDTVTVNGIEAEVDGENRFSATFSPEVGLNLIIVEATNAVGQTNEVTRSMIYGNFQPSQQQTVDALGGFLRADAFEVLSEFAGPLIEDQLRTAMSGALATGPLEVTSIDYERIEVTMAPADGYIHTTLALYGFTVGIRVEQDVWVTTIVIEGELAVDPAYIEAQITPTISDTGAIGIDLALGEVQMDNFEIRIDNVPGFITDLASGLIGTVVELILPVALSSFALDDLFDPATLLREIDLLGFTLQFDFLVTSIPITPAGLALFANAAVYGAVEEARGPGSLHLDGLLEQMPAERSFNLALAYNFINQLLYAFWEVGAMDLNISELLDGLGGGVPIPLNVAGLSLLLGDELSANYPPSEDVILSMRPLLPPVGMPLLNPDEGAMSIFVGDLLIDFSVPVDGEPELFATAATYMELAVDLAWVDGGIVPSIALLAIVDLDAEPVFDLDDQRFEDGLEGIVDLVPSLLAGGLGEFGLGDFGGLELSDMVFRSLEKAPYLLVGADLSVAAPPEDEATP